MAGPGYSKKFRKLLEVLTSVLRYISMKLEIVKPSPDLKEYIQYYWLLEGIPSPDDLVQRIIPTGLPELLVNYGDRLLCTGDEPGTLPPRMTLCGQRNTFYDVRQTGETRLVSALFTPAGASLFFHDSFASLLNRSVSLKEMFPFDSELLYERICSSGSSMEKIGVLESFIKNRITSRYRRDFSLLNGIISAIKESRGDITVDTICHNFGINYKFLERRFSQYIGMTPKNFLRIVRFQNVLDSYDKSGGSLTDLSLDCGYYDQSHFIREIREFTGYSPQDLFRTCCVHSDFFAA